MCKSYDHIAGVVWSGTFQTMLVMKLSLQMMPLRPVFILVEDSWWCLGGFEWWPDTEMNT